MYSLYNFVSGPLAWAAFIIFVGGGIYRLVHILGLVHRKEKFITSYMSWKYSLRSILHWSIPFAAENMRRNPVLTLVSFAFHICLLLTPIFLLAHVVLVDEAWHLSWWALPNQTALAMTLVVIAGCGFFLARRWIAPQVRYVTFASDYFMLAIVAAPFVTGFLAYFQWFDYRLMLILHIVTGEIMLAAIPFTRLGHMLLAFLTRAYMGSEFGGVRRAKDW